MKASMSCLLKTLLAIFAFSLFSFPSSAKDVVYVRSGADGDGSSWTNAFGNLQQAVDSAEKKGADVWVAKGVYYAMDDNQYVVDLKPNVNLYGGFAGDEASLADRDTAKNPTVLDGDERNSVVSQDFKFADSDSALVDGFIIKGGKRGKMESGGGVYLNNNVTIRNCIIKENINAIYIYDSKILCSQIIHNTFTNPYVINCHQSIIEDCRIQNNSSGGVFLKLKQSILNRCIIEKNSSFRQLLDVNLDSKITNCLISENITTEGHLICLWERTLMSNCTVVKNEARAKYDAFQDLIYLGCSCIIQNSIIVGNKCDKNIFFNCNPPKKCINNVIESNDKDGNMDGSLKWVAFNDPENGDYSLSEKSICINAGLDVDDSLDLYGNPRKQGSRVDLGAIESTLKEVPSLNVGEIVYVKIGSDGDGSSWKSAFGDVKSALIAASLDSKRHQIWVAKGTYYGDSTSYNWLTLCPGVSLYGGFFGDETSLLERDIEKNPTILDGMELQRVIAQQTDFADSMAVVIDGFTIQNGLKNFYAKGSIINSKKNSTFSNCIFRYAYGGLCGIMAENTTFRKCKFVDLYSMYKFYSNTSIIEIHGGVINSCHFDGKSSENIRQVICADRSVITNSKITEYDFATYVLSADNSFISHCEISNNNGRDGYITYGPCLIQMVSSTLSNSLVYGNSAMRSYLNNGMILYIFDASSIENSTIANNTNQNINTIWARTDNGNIDPIISNSIIWGNKIIGENIPQVDKSEYIQILSCASDEELAGENNIKLESSNNGSDTSKNYVCFINPVGGDYRLHSTSSCIDKGIDSLAKAEKDINGGVRIYGKAVDLGAIEYDGEYVEMPYYGQTICYNKYSFEAAFDSTIDRIDWSVVDTGNIEGVDSLSGSGKTIPSMQLRTSKNDIDTLTLLVKTYDKDGLFKSSFNYYLIVYPDFSDKKVTFSWPDEYVVNGLSNEMTLIWNKLKLPVDIDKYDLYVWRSTKKIPATPTATFDFNTTTFQSTYDNHATYKYMVEAIVGCDTIVSDIDSFRIEIPVHLGLIGNAECVLGSNLNETSSLTRNIKGFELESPISFRITGRDSSDFSIEMENGWDSLNGGSIRINYLPTNVKKQSSIAELHIKSGEYEVTLYLDGVLSNYYVYDVVVGNDVYDAGDSVDVVGILTDAYGNPIIGKTLVFDINSNTGFSHSTTAITDSTGKAYVKFATGTKECGSYTVKVYIGSDIEKAAWTEFAIPGMGYADRELVWLIQKGDTLEGTFTIMNKSSVDLHNVFVDASELADGLSVDFEPLSVLKGNESTKISFRATGTKVTSGDVYLSSIFRVSCDENVSCDFLSYFYCEHPYGQIKVYPATIDAHVSKQNLKRIDLELTNSGFGETGEISLSLPDFAGFKVVSTTLPSIKSGDTVNISLDISYFPEAMINVPYMGTIGVNCANGRSTQLSYRIEYSSESTGSLEVDVVDEYFYNTTSKKHLGGAKVVLRNQYDSREIASSYSDSTGIVRFDSIPEGIYLMSVTAEKHGVSCETIEIQAGQKLNKLIFLPYQAITYSWKVERTEIEDKYDITLDFEYETKVPAPVVTVVFPNGVPDKDKFEVGVPKTVPLQITNHGLIAAKHVSFGLDQCPYFKFFVPYNSIDSLPANYTEYVPVTIIRTEQDQEQVAEIKCAGVPLDIRDGKSECPHLHAEYAYHCGILRVMTAVTKNPWTGCDSIVNLYPIAENKEKLFFHKGGSDVGFDGKESNPGSVFVKDLPCYFSCLSRVNPMGCVKDAFLPSFIKDLLKVKNVTTKSVGLLREYWKARKAGNEEKEDAVTKEAIDFVAEEGVSLFKDKIPLVNKIPFECVDLACQLSSCSYGKYAENCKQFHKDRREGNNDENDDKVIVVNGDSIIIENGEISDVYYSDGDHLSGNNKQTSMPGVTTKLGQNSFFKIGDPQALASRDVIELAGFIKFSGNIMKEFAGSESLLSKNGIVDYFNYTYKNYSTGKKIDLDSLKILPVLNLTVTEMIEMAQRWNETLDARENGIYSPNEQYPNIVDKKIIDSNIDSVFNFSLYMLLRGHKSINEMTEFINSEWDKTEDKSVCASVKLQMSQTMTMTREAFDGTLTVSNGNESGAMENFKVVIEIRDDKGELANDLFQINTEKLTGISAVDGTGEIASMSEGTALFRFIPTKMAAPVSPKNYSFGGYISYVDPASGDTVKADLYPVTLTVNPSPDLQIDYFMQRNILGDDALTLDRVEPSIPAALGVRIDNQGYGLAKNVKLETAQPEIVDNEKGLLIDFDIIGSSMDGKDCDLGSENINFGNIEPQSSKTGVWWMTSSLLGHFTKYDASVVHANSFGNPELSLVKEIKIHELVKTVDAYGNKEDGVVDFLVNDDNDFKGYPDTIYYSNGGKDVVNEAYSYSLGNDSMNSEDSILTLVVTPSKVGWNYAQMVNPGCSLYDIQKVVRVKDGVEIPLDNVWTTFVTLPNGEDPIYEDRLHFLDYMSTLEETRYDIYFSLKKNILEVSEITNVPIEVEAVNIPVENVVVKFNRKIQKESFDYKDIELFCQAGDNLSDSTISVTSIDDLTYNVNISSKTKVSGFYKIEINVNNVYDENGYPGVMGKNATWSELITEIYDTVIPLNPDTLSPVSPDIETPNDTPEDIKTSIAVVENDEFMVYSYQNSIYVKSSKSGSFDIYDVLSRMVAKDVHYGVGVSRVATLPKGVYIINGNKVIVQ